MRSCSKQGQEKSLQLADPVNVAQTFLQAVRFRSILLKHEQPMATKAKYWRNVSSPCSQTGRNAHEHAERANAEHDL